MPSLADAQCCRLASRCIVTSCTEPTACLWSAAASAELINGRLAMLGIVFSAIQEAKTGLTVREQAQQLNVPMFILLGSIAYASLVPIMKGAKTEAFGERCVWVCLVWLGEDAVWLCRGKLSLVRCITNQL